MAFCHLVALKPFLLRNKMPTPKKAQAILDSLHFKTSSKQGELKQSSWFIRPAETAANEVIRKKLRKRQLCNLVFYDNHPLLGK
jgi:hypothetical protein